MASTCPASGVPAGPLSALALSHAHTANWCVALEDLAQTGASAEPASCLTAARMLAAFDADTWGHQSRESRLFPLLRTSMAGPDIQRLCDMTEALAAEHRALQRLWAPLRLPLACLAIGASPSLDAGQVAGFLSLYRRHQAREAQELLPLASALFADAELAWLQTRPVTRDLPPLSPSHGH